MNRTEDDNDVIEFPMTDSADPDWRPKFKLLASQATAMRLRGLLRDSRRRIREPFIKTFDAALHDAYETGDHHAAEMALARLDEQLLKAAVMEFERLRKLNGNGVADFQQALVDHGWNGLEIDTIPCLLAPGERLARVDFRFIETSKGRCIGLPEIQQAAKPSTQTNGRWPENFIGEANLRELEAKAESKNTRPPCADSCNRDLPNGILQP
jgi:hypothetical protein